MLTSSGFQRIVYLSSGVVSGFELSNLANERMANDDAAVDVRPRVSVRITCQDGWLQR